MAARDILMSAAGAAGAVYVDDVFSTYLYTGNGSSQTINNGIDLAGKGGLVWIKQRSNATDHILRDSVVQLALSSNSANAGTDPALAGSITSLNSSGFGVDAASTVNGNSSSYVSWTFRKADKFFTTATINHTNGSPTNIALGSLVTVGQVIAKITNTTGDWIVWHRGLTAGNNLRLNTTAAQTSTNAWLSVSGTTATLSASAPTGTYVVYAWAHDTSPEGIIQCGSFTTDGSGNATVNLGWEPQFVLAKPSSTSGYDWYMLDVVRGWDQSVGDKMLRANSSAAEDSGSQFGTPTATGFTVTGGNWGPTGTTSVYLAIRRPNKPPTSGAGVFSANTLNTTNPTTIVTGFPPDLVISKDGRATTTNNFVHDRLRGANASTGQQVLVTNAASAEVASSGRTDLTTVSNGYRYQSNITNLIGWAFRRAPGFFDVVCYTGTGVARTVNHNLGVAPELMIVKSRSTGLNWYVYHKALGVTGNDTLFLNTDSAAVADSGGYWNNTLPVSAQFSLGTSGNVNTNGATYVAYLFATLAGISKVGSYTGNGSSQTINCGFSTGSRFVMVKRTNNTGDWYVWDTARGIIAGNDPHLSLNTIAAEVTTDDSIDPDITGFTVNQLAATNINVNAATYIFLAIA